MFRLHFFKLESLYKAECFVYISSDWQVTNCDVPQNTLRVNDIGGSERDSSVVTIFDEAAIITGYRLSKIRDHGNGHWSKAAFVLWLLLRVIELGAVEFAARRIVIEFLARERRDNAVWNGVLTRKGRVVDVSEHCQFLGGDAKLDEALPRIAVLIGVGAKRYLERIELRRGLFLDHREQTKVQILALGLCLILFLFLFALSLLSALWRLREPNL